MMMRKKPLVLVVSSIPLMLLPDDVFMPMPRTPQLQPPVPRQQTTLSPQNHRFLFIILRCCYCSFLDEHTIYPLTFRLRLQSTPSDATHDDQQPQT
jgi:hypothetical protein